MPKHDEQDEGEIETPISTKAPAKGKGNER